MKKLEGKVAVITGGSSGIGLATAQFMREEGAIVVIVGRSQQKLDIAAKQINGTVTTISANAAVVADIEKVMEQVKALYGRIDILFANAGMSDCPPMLEATEADFNEVMDINVKGVFFLFTKAFPLLVEGSSVIFTSSVAHFKGRPGDPLYSASKAAVRSFGRTMALDEAVIAKKIRVNVVTPGAIKTPLTQQDTPEMIKAIDDYIATTVPMQRWGTADEIAKTVVFLASDDASFITGSEILVDGGLGQI